MCYQRLWRDGVQIMKKLAFILLFACSSVFAQDPWFLISSSESFNYFGKKESFELTKTGGRFLIKYQGKTSKEPFFTFAEMKTSDCKKEYGTIYFFDFNGKKEFEAPYVSEGGTIASLAGDMICSLLKNKPSI